MIFGEQARENLRRSFAAQFEAADGGFLYRLNRRGEAIRVNAEEKADFIAGYDRAVRGFGWATIGAIFAAFGLAAAMGRSDQFERHRWIVAVAVVVAFMAAHAWIWRAPARALRYRVASRGPLPPEDRRALYFARIEYPKLALGLLAAPFAVWAGSRVTDILHGWGRLWIAAAVALVVLVIVQGVRKWRYEAGLRP